MIVAWSSPIFASAAGLSNLIDASFGIVTGVLTPLAFALCLFYFFWGMAKYVRTGASSPDAAKEGKNIMIWGVVGLFVAVTIWGIVSFIRGELRVPEIDRTSPGISLRA